MRRSHLSALLCDVVSNGPMNSYNNDMDITIREASEALGTSVPRVTRAIRALDIPLAAPTAALSTEGRSEGRAPRTFDSSEMVRLERHLGAVPIQVPADLSREELFVLAGLNQSPLGLRSARLVAEAAGVSPTTATRVLPGLIKRGLVSATPQRVRESRRVVERTIYEANRLSDPWRGVQEAIRLTATPDRATAPV